MAQFLKLISCSGVEKYLSFSSLNRNLLAMKSNFSLPKMFKNENPNETVKQFTLAKIGKIEHLELLRRGQVHFKRLSFYKSLEGKDKPYHDPNESVHTIYPVDNIKVEIDMGGGRTAIFDRSTGLQSVVASSHFNPLVSCFYSVHIADDEMRSCDNDLEKINDIIRPDKALSKYGNHILVIHNVMQFQDRLKKAVENRKLVLDQSFIRYVDPVENVGVIDENMLGFVKLKSFANERELRMRIVNNHSNESYNLDVGSLEDISDILPFEQFATMKVKPAQD